MPTMRLRFPIWDNPISGAGLYSAERASRDLEPGAPMRGISFAMMELSLLR